MEAQSVSVGVVSQFADGVRRFRWMGSPLYSAFCRWALDDAELLALAGQAPAGQPYTHLLFAAVHLLVLEDADTPLSEFYASVSDPPRDDPKAAFQAFRAFCRERVGEIAAVMKKRTVQFTVVGRAAFVLPAVAYVAREVGSPLSFIDIGCSAGLLTSFAGYDYDYGSGLRVGGGGELMIDSFRFVGNPPAFLTEVPKVCRAIGVDLNPIDPADPKERRWIDALCPPDMVDERRQLRAALDLRTRTALHVLRADALLALPGLLATMPDPICALAAHCLYQWPADARARLDAVFRAASAGRSLSFITVDHPAALDPTRTDTAYGREDRSGDEAPIEHEAVLTTYQDGRADRTLLGRYDSFGRRGVWLAGMNSHND